DAVLDQRGDAGGGVRDAEGALIPALSVFGQVGDEATVRGRERGDLRSPHPAGHAAAVEKDDGGRGGGARVLAEEGHGQGVYPSSCSCISLASAAVNPRNALSSSSYGASLFQGSCKELACFLLDRPYWRSSPLSQGQVAEAAPRAASVRRTFRPPVLPRI